MSKATPRIFTAELKGNSRERGFQHGRILKAPICHAVNFYREFFAEHVGIDSQEMRRRASRFIESTARISGLLMSEYEGLAEGSGQTLEDIFALSARYEITYETVKLGECSNVFVGPKRSADGRALLGMNWEWRPEVLDFRAVLISRCDDLPDHIVVTECGQPGKYGVNEHGVASIESGLGCSQATSDGDALFVVVLRHVLAQSDLTSAARVIREHLSEATISFFLADGSGCGINYEISPTGVAERQLGLDEVYWHTNHCLLTEEPCSFEDSFVRAERWRELTGAADGVTWQTVGRWLADTENGPNAICKAPNPALSHTTTWLQTLCSIVIDPYQRALWVSNGLSSQNPYVRFDFDSRCPNPDN